MKITSLKVNHVSEPLGYEMENLTFSWKVLAVGDTKKYSRVWIASDENFENIIFDSGNDEGIDGVCYTVDIELSPRTKYYWKVSVTSNKDETATNISCFETGKMGENWQGKWIYTDEKIMPYMVKNFTVNNTDNARMYVVGRGCYEIYCNGQRVGDDYLDPGYYSYDLWEQAHTYDISPYLKTGENVIGVTIGDAWYLGRLGWDDNYNNVQGKKLMLLAEIFVDGKIIPTDDTWLYAKSPVVETNIYDGEVFDARMEIPNWSTCECDFTSWKNVLVSDEKLNIISDKLRAPTQKHEVFTATVITTPKGETVLDFGQNIAGWVEGELNLACGEKITLQHGEILQDECFYNVNLRTAKAEYTYISNGEKANFRPRFTFYGFRYVKVNGNISADDIKTFKAYALYSEMEEVGKIETGDELVNKLISNILWGQKGNFLDVPTDCPQRDERLGWTGDTQIFATTACYNTDSLTFYTKHMKDLIEEQKLLNGGVPFVVPMLRNVNGSKSLSKHSSCAWGDVATVLPWVMYEFYGDKSLLEKHYISMTSWTEFIKSEDEKAGGNRLWKTGFHFADWLALDNYKAPNSPFGATDEYYVASVWYAYSAMLTAKAAKILGKKDDTVYYENLYEEICEAIRNEYFTKNGRCAIDTQTAKVLALHMNIVRGEDRKRVADDLAKQLHNNDMKLETGFCGTPFLCTALTSEGYTEEAYTLLLNKEIPGWLYEVLMGATTIWERWNSVMPDGTMNPLGMNSLNHYAYGAVEEWMYKDVCGIRLHENSAGFKAVDIAPKPDKRIGKAICKFNSAGGEYKVSWEYTDGKIVYNLTIPFDRTAYVSLKNKENMILNSGEYKFETEE